jgi:hypothetical protein
MVLSCLSSQRLVTEEEGADPTATRHFHIVDNTMFGRGRGIPCLVASNKTLQLMLQLMLRPSELCL